MPWWAGPARGSPGAGRRHPVAGRGALHRTAFLGPPARTPAVRRGTAGSADPRPRCLPHLRGRAATTGRHRPCTDLEMDLTVPGCAGRRDECGAVAERARRGPQADAPLRRPVVGAARPATGRCHGGGGASRVEQVGQSVANAGDPEATWHFTIEALIESLSARLGPAATGGRTKSGS